MNKLQLIREEIERLKDCASPIVVCDTLLQFIDSIQEEPKGKGFFDGVDFLPVVEKQEPISEDLDFQTFAKEMDKVFALPSDITKNTEEDPLNWEYAIARHFANWQKQQMMKDAQLGIIEERADGLLGWNTVYGTDKDYRNYLLSHFKNGDEVKLIIIKEE